jgi:hypothetical protein
MTGSARPVPSCSGAGPSQPLSDAGRLARSCPADNRPLTPQML